MDLLKDVFLGHMCFWVVLSLSPSLLGLFYLPYSCCFLVWLSVGVWDFSFWVTSGIRGDAFCLLFLFFQGVFFLCCLL